MFRLSLLLICLCFSLTIAADPRPIFQPTVANNAMVVSSEQHATQAALDVLKQGGNAIDAAVTLGFVKAVTYPQAGNLGGGGFMLVYLAKTQQVVAIDYREKAPLKAHRNMFLDADGNVDKNLSRFSYLAAGVPATVAGFALALEKYGTISLAQALAPAIELAEQGFLINQELSYDLQRWEKSLKKHPSTAEIFYKADGSFYQMGERLVQKELARSLRLLAVQGTAAFYQGKIADLIVKQMQTNGGLISKADLAQYQAKIRQPIQGQYRGFDVFSMSPPSSGGVHIVQILNILENHDLRALGHNSASSIHVMAEAMKRAYADRAKYLGDSDFVNVPLQGLTAKSYAKHLSQQITDKATPSKTIFAGKPSDYESPQTTHYSVVDKAGNAVSNTYTLNFSFGSGIVVKGTGILLNNQMDDFSAKAGVPNAYGLIGGSANAIEPEKRMLSSMSPTIVLKDGKPFIVTGSPGGSRIITTTLQVILNVIDHGMNIQEAVNAVRVHHQWYPDEIRVEKGLNSDTINLLQQKGHQVVLKSPMGSAASILVSDGVFYGGTDPRTQGLALGY